MICCLHDCDGTGASAHIMMAWLGGGSLGASCTCMFDGPASAGRSIHTAFPIQRRCWPDDESCQTTAPRCVSNADASQGQHRGQSGAWLQVRKPVLSVSSGRISLCAASVITTPSSVRSHALDSTSSWFQTTETWGPWGAEWLWKHALVVIPMFTPSCVCVCVCVCVACCSEWLLRPSCCRVSTSLRLILSLWVGGPSIAESTPDLLSPPVVL